MTQQSTRKKIITFCVWVTLLGLVLFLYDHEPNRTFVDFERFLTWVDEDRVKQVRVDANELNISLYDGREFVTLGFLDDDRLRDLSAQQVRVSWESKSPLDSPWVVVFMVGVGVFLLWIVIRARNQGTQGLMSLMKSKARKVGKEHRTVRFADVGGAFEAKERLADVIDYVKDPRAWTAAGVRFPRGILLEGPPGCGKTLLARAVAGEASVPFFVVSGSEFVEMFVGVGAARVRDTFEKAAKEAPSVVFIDELDAVGRRRGSGIGAGHDEREQTLNQLLVCLDGFEPTHQVVVLAATNRADVLDPALLRPGRFDARVRIEVLTRDERLETLKIHTRRMTLDDEGTLTTVADRTDGSTGAMLEHLAGEAALTAMRRCRMEGRESPRVELRDFESALRSQEGESSRFDQLDALLIDSVTQLTQPTGKIEVMLRLRDGTELEGSLVWADNAMVKLRETGSGRHVIVAKQHIAQMEPRAGTDVADEVIGDPWGKHQPGTM